MKTNTLTFFNITILAINSFLLFRQNKNNHIIATSKERSEKVIEKLFIPNFLFIGSRLYQKITPDNSKEMLLYLIKFKKDIEENDLSFYLGSFLIKVTNETIELINKKPRKFKKINKSFIAFSYHYFKNQNHFRKIIGLPKYGFWDRINLKLYKNLPTILFSFFLE